MRRLTSCAAAIALTIGSSGCGHVKTLPPRPASDRLTCADEPPVPALAADPVARDNQKADYLTALWSAWADCWSVVRWHRDWWDAQK